VAILDITVTNSTKLFRFHCICIPCLIFYTTILFYNVGIDLCLKDSIGFCGLLDLDFLQGHSHCAVYNEQSSELCEITASIIQGSAIGPAMLVVEAADLKAITPWKFALQIRRRYVNYNPSQQLSRPNIDLWAKLNNHTLTPSKTAKAMFADKKSKLAYCYSTTTSPWYYYTTQ